MNANINSDWEIEMRRRSKRKYKTDFFFNFFFKTVEIKNDSFDWATNELVNDLYYVS